MIRRLREGKFTARSRETKGIEIRPWLVHIGNAKIKVRTWDFAGQVITHATHQFFLSQRSLYVLVITGRENSEQLDSEYWLKLIQAFGTEALEHTDSRDSKRGTTAPVIVALNKCRSSPCNLDREKLRENYPFIVDFVETDCKSGTGIVKLRRLIVSTILEMESVRKSFPKSWFSIKEQLEQDGRDYLSYPDFIELCQRQGVTDPNKQSALFGLASSFGHRAKLR